MAEESKTKKKIEEVKIEEPRIKIKKIVESEPRFEFKEVEMREPKVADTIKAQIACGQVDGYAFAAALMAECCLFDGKKQVYETLKTMTRRDFLELNAAFSSDMPA